MNKFVYEIVELAKISFKNDEVPVGAIVVRNNEIIGRGFNDREYSHLITGHAELKAINEACLYLNDWRLDDCELYVTLKPCSMCSGAIESARIKKVYYLTDKTDVCEKNDTFVYEMIDNTDKYNEYVKLLKLFFENKRNL